MIKSKSIKYLNFIMVALLLCFPIVNAIPNDFVTAIAQPRLDGKLSLKDKSANKSHDRALYAPVKTALDVHMVHNDITLVAKNNTDTKKVKANDFVATVAGTKISPDTKTSISDVNELAKVPEAEKGNFKIKVDGTYKGTNVKVFKSPYKDAEVSTSAFIVPSDIISDDLTVYNSHYFKVKDDLGNSWYIDTNQSNWEIISNNNKYHIAGSYGNYTVTDKIKNITLDLQTPTNLTADEIVTLTQGTGLEGIEDAVVEIEERYGINALFTVALAMLESGHGESWLAVNRNNLFGICAYDTDTDAATSFSSKSECVRYWGKLIHDEYFAHGRTTLESINAIYASSPVWADHVMRQMIYNSNQVQ